MQYMHRQWLQRKLSWVTLHERAYCYILYSAQHVHIIFFSYVLDVNQWGRGGNRALHWNSESPPMLMSSQQRGIHSKTFSDTGEMVRLSAVRKKTLFSMGCKRVRVGAGVYFLLNQRSEFSTRHAFASNAAPRGSDVSGIKSNTLNRHELQPQ